MRLFDSHCHLDFPTLSSQIASVLDEAESAGVCGWLVPGCRASTWQRLRSLKQQVTPSFVVELSVGQHPYFGGEVEDLEQFAATLHSAALGLGALAIGECGVDKTRGGPDVQQAALLRTHLLVARQLELPLILHQVGMREVLLDCLREVGLSDRGGVVHGFSGDLAWGKALIQRGFLLGIGAGIIRKGRGRLREAVAQLPLDRMVLETDAPDQGPKSGMQAQNTGRPSDLRAVAERLAELKGVSLDLVATTTTKAACECFAIQLLEDPAST